MMMSQAPCSAFIHALLGACVLGRCEGSLRARQGKRFWVFFLSCFFFEGPYLMENKQCNDNNNDSNDSNNDDNHDNIS